MIEKPWLWGLVAEREALWPLEQPPCLSLGPFKKNPRLGFFSRGEHEERHR